MPDNIYGGVHLARNEVPGATVTIDLNYLEDTRMWTAGEVETVNISGTQKAGRDLFFIISNDGVLPRVITFGSGFKSIGTMTGVLSKSAVVHFVSDGTNFLEVTRTIGI